MKQSATIRGEQEHKESAIAPTLDVDIGDYSGDSDSDQQATNEELLFDTTIPEEVKEFVDTVRGYGEQDGAAFALILERLPKTANSLGVGKTKLRILKTLKKFGYLPSDFRDTVSRFTKVQIKDYNDAIQKCWTERRNPIVACTVYPFESFINAQQNPALRMSSSSEGNQVAYMAHLLTLAETASLWEQLADGPRAECRRAALDQLVPFREQILQKILSVGEAMKDHLNYDKFSLCNICEEAREACMSLDPTSVTFSCPGDLLALKTKWVNLYDELQARVTRSGQHVPDSYEYRKEVWENYVGSPGRSKNVPLYYCYILWQDCQLRWTTRRLPAAAGVSSIGETLPSQPRDPDHSSSTVFSRREMRQLAMVQAALNPPVRSDTAVDDSKKRVLDQKASAIKASKIQKFIDSSSFDLIPPDEQQEYLQMLRHALRE